MRLISNLKRAKYIGAAMVLLLAATPVSPIATWITGSNKASAIEEEVTEVSTWGELKTAFADGKSSIKLMADIVVSSTDETEGIVKSDAVFDMNGHSVTFSVDKRIVVVNGATFTITGNGSIVKTNNSNFAVLATDEGGNVILQNGKITATIFAVDVYRGSFTINGGTIESGEYGVDVYESTLNMNGGKIKSDALGVGTYANSVVNIKNGAIEAGYYGISSNGRAVYGGSKINVSGGKINATEVGIYAPHYDGETTISGGIITGGTGIEIRSGKLNVTGGTITANASAYVVEPADSGYTTEGAAIAIAQHTTRQPINANISGGMFIGPVALSQADPEEGDATNESISVSGGTFISNNGNSHSVEIEDKAVATFSGGAYNDLNITPGEVKDGYAIYQTENGYEVLTAPSLGDTPKQNLAEVGAKTVLPGIVDNEEFQEYGIVVNDSGAKGMTFNKETGEVEPAVPEVSKITLGFEVYKLDGEDVVRDTQFDKTIQVHGYKYNELGTIYLEKGTTTTKNPGVELDTERDEYQVYIDEDEQSVATYDETTGEIEAKGFGEAQIKLKVAISNSNPSKEIEKTIGTVKVYSFEAADEVTIPAGAEIDLQDGIISKIGNPSAITVELADDDSTVELSDSTGTADTTLTALKAGAPATLTFKAGEETLGTTTVKVYEKPELNNILLQSYDSDGDLETSATFPKLEGENLPEYSVVTDNPTLISISNNSDGSKRIRTRYSYQHSGNATGTVIYHDSYYDEDNLGESTKDSFVITVSKFREDYEDQYEVAAGDEIGLTMRESNNKGEVTCTVDDEDCEESDDFTVSENNGQWTIATNDDATAGSYTFKFTDEFKDVITEGETEKAAERTVTVRVHEIEVKDEDGYDVNALYVLRDAEEAQTITVKEKHGWGQIGYIVRDEQGEASHGRVRVNQSGDNVTISLYDRNDVAGYYTIEFQDCERMSRTHYCENPVASKTIENYAIDFEVKDMKYYVNNNDTTENLINAINHYWGENGGSTGIGSVKHSDDRTTSRFRVTQASSGAVEEGDGYNFRIRNGGASADVYKVDLYAYVNNVEVDSKTVEIYVYDMTHPSSNTFYGEINDTNIETGYVFEGITIGDVLNDLLPADSQEKSTFSAVLKSGDQDSIIIDVENGTVTAKKPGQYVVEYQDIMPNNVVADTYTATFNVYGLSADVEDAFLNLNAGEKYGWTIDPSQTYGDVETTIVRWNPEGVRRGTVYNDTTNYDGTSTEAEEAHTYDPAARGEGRYRIRVDNNPGHGQSRLREEANFYVIAREYDFIMVEKGTPVTITSNSRWSVDRARTVYQDFDQIDGQTVTIDTNSLPLGTNRVYLEHQFNDEPETWATLKNVVVVTYEVVPSDDSQELNKGEVTTATIKELYEKVAKKTAELINELIEAGTPPALVDNLSLQLMASMLSGEISDEMIEQYGLADIFDEVKQLFADAEDPNGLKTAGKLNFINWLPWFEEENQKPVETEVRVTPLADDEVDAKEKADIEKALSGLNVDNIDYYDVSVLIKYSGQELGKLHKLNGEITVALAEIEESATGYTRQYFVVRDHNGEVTILVEGEDYYIENGVIYIISDEFSTYAVAFKDTLIPKSPDTGKEVSAESSVAPVNTSTAIIAVLAAITVTGAVVFAKRK